MKSRKYKGYSDFSLLNCQRRKFLVKYGYSYIKYIGHGISSMP